MANTVAVNSVARGRKQFGGAFGDDMWLVKATMSDQDAIAIGDTLAVTMAVPGVVLGDMVVGKSISVDLLDGGGDGATFDVVVTAANVCTIYLHADKAEFAADSLNGGVIKFIVATPSW